MTSLTWLSIALLAGFGAVGWLLIRMRAEIRECANLVSHAVAHMPVGGMDPDSSPAEEWQEAAAIQPGGTAPGELRAGSDKWLIAVFGRDPEVITAGLPMDGEVDHLRARYRVVVATGAEVKADFGGLEVVRLPESVFEHVPPCSVAMIDPDGTVQGVGSVVAGADLLAFVADGEHHGFGHPQKPEPTHV